MASLPCESRKAIQCRNSNARVPAALWLAATKAIGYVCHVHGFHLPRLLAVVSGESIAGDLEQPGPTPKRSQATDSSMMERCRRSFWSPRTKSRSFSLKSAPFRLPPEKALTPPTRPRTLHSCFFEFSESSLRLCRVRPSSIAEFLSRGSNPGMTECLRRNADTVGRGAFATTGRDSLSVAMEYAVTIVEWKLACSLGKI
jgi:hypothetical protein